MESAFLKQALTGVYADYYDNLELAQLPTVSSNQVSLVTAIPGPDSTALVNKGVTKVINLTPYPGPADASSAVSSLANAVSIVGAKVALVDVGTAGGLALQKNLIANTNGYGGTVNIYILGVGKNCTLVGGNSSMLEAPTRTGTSPGDNSTTFYQRYCVAFAVDDGTGPGRRVTFLGAVVPTVNGFALTEDSTTLYNAN